MPRVLSCGEHSLRLNEGADIARSIRFFPLHVFTPLPHHGRRFAPVSPQYCGTRKLELDFRRRQGYVVKSQLLQFVSSKINLSPFAFLLLSSRNSTGGVGKTTTSCCLAVQLAKVRPNVLVVSTDPAHNLSDAFGQKFGREPVKVNGFENLFCMEVDSSGEQEWEAIEAAQLSQGLATDGLESGVGSIMKDLMTSVPGIDEAMAFAELMKMVQEMNYSTIVFDTAPTGHTLRLLSFPKTMESAIGKLLELKVRPPSSLANLLC